ncbi:NAD(P)H-binding protein [Planosporangium thailandense]|uniref:NAD(P)H-binding protein n=2 Tax=Planosporangium thailandense TaxID=765197 RepID=A0ABX0Y2I1_9ACTN|nr:NAD(P)H-binding protein [Planosporangium thailandense]NJC72569.1 NAD(P)H-binding protein [Planosporangium thailandense]
MILVTGATGNVGRQVVDQLLEAGERVRATSRDPARAGLPAEVDVRRADLRDPDTLPAVLDGVDRAYLFPVPGQVGGFLAAARKAGLRRIVLLSSQAVTFDPRDVIGRAHAEYERAVEESGLAWTFVRPGAFMANDLAWAPAIRADGVVRAPYGRAATAPIHERDIAAVAVRALLDDGHAGRAYELTGPESLTAVERVRLIGASIGRDLRYEEQPPDEARRQMATHTPPAIVDAVLSILASAVGAGAPVLPTVEEVTGRPAASYTRWVGDHAADFR